jgi:small-conductance mechanosensitive channel
MSRVGSGIWAASATRDRFPGHRVETKSTHRRIRSPVPPETLVFVKRFMESAVELEVHACARAGDWWTLRTQLPRLIRVRFREAGIETPYPREVQYERPEPAVAEPPPA